MIGPIFAMVLFFGGGACAWYFLIERPNQKELAQKEAMYRRILGYNDSPPYDFSEENE